MRPRSRNVVVALASVVTLSLGMNAGSRTAWCGDEPAPAAGGKAGSGRNSGAALAGEFGGAASAGWFRDPEAKIDEVPVWTWLERVGSRDATEATSARRALLGLGPKALPWIALGLDSKAMFALHEPCATLASELWPSTGLDAAAAATDPRMWMRIVAVAASRRGGLSDGARRVALGDDVASVRREAALGFLVAKTLAPETLAALESALADADDGARTAAALAILRAGGPVAARLVASLDRPESRSRLPVTCLLFMPAEAEDGMLALLASRSWNVRGHALTALALAPRLSERAVHAITPLLRDEAGAVRWRAACALDRVEARSAVEALRASLSDSLPDVAAAAAVALSTLGSFPPEAVPALVGLLVPSPTTLESGNLIPSFAELLGPRWYVYVGETIPPSRAATALAGHGAAGVASLRAAVQGGNANARRLAVSVYAAAGEAGAQPLRESLADADEGVRQAAAIALARRGDARVQVVETLALRAGWDPIVDGRIERVDALLSLGVSALPSVRALLRKADHDLQPGLLAALVAMREKAAPAIPDLLPLSLDSVETLPGERSTSTSTFEKAIRAIGEAGVPGLIDGLRSENADVRERAFRACRLLGPAAKPALPALRDALRAKRIPGWEDVSADDPIHPIE